MSSVSSTHPTSTISGGKNGTAKATAAAAAAAAAASKAKYAALAKQEFLNQKTVKYYAAALMGVICLFTVFHWCRFLYSRYAPKGLRKSGLMRAQVSVVRYGTDSFDRLQH